MPVSSALFWKILAVVGEPIVDVVFELLVFVVALCCFPQALKSWAVLVSTGDSSDLDCSCCLVIVQVLLCKLLVWSRV